MARKRISQHDNAADNAKFWAVIDSNMEAIRRSFFHLQKRWPSYSSVDVESDLHDVIMELHRLDKVHTYRQDACEDIERYLFAQIDAIMSHRYDERRTKASRTTGMTPKAVEVADRSVQAYDDVREVFEAGLTPEERDWLTSVFDGLSGKEIAELSGVSESVVSLRKRRVVNKFRDFAATK